MPPKNNNKDAGTYLSYNTGKQTYKPVLRPGGLTEEVLTTGDPGVLNRFLKENVSHLTDEEIMYLNLRREAQDAFLRERGKQWNILVSKDEEKPLPAVENKNGFIGFSDLKYTEPQSATNGCWSCALSLMLRSRGVDLTQEQIRAWKPIQGKAKLNPQAAYDRNADTGFEIIDDADLITEVSPNTAVSSMSVNVMDKDSFFVVSEDGTEKEATPEQKEKIFTEYIKQAKDTLVSKIKESISVHQSPVALTWDGHTITVTGIREDGMLRYQDSRAVPMEQFISADKVIEQSLTPHTKVTYQGQVVNVDPTGLGITWLHEAPVTSFEKDPDMREVDFGLINDCITVDGTGKVKAAAPEGQDVFMTINRKGAGIISSEGIMTNVTMDTTALEKDLGVKGVICFGGKPLLSESNTLYPSKLIQKDNKRNAEAYLRKLSDSFGIVSNILNSDTAKIEPDEVEKDVKGFKEKFERLDDIVFAFYEGYGNKEEMGVKALREIPELLTHKFDDGKTLCQHINSRLSPDERVKFLRELKEIDRYYGLDIDFGKALGEEGPVYVADTEHKANREKRFDKLKTELDANRKSDEWYKNQLNRIVKEEQLWQSGCSKAHISVNSVDLTEEQKKKNEIIYDNIRQNGGFKAFVNDAGSIDELFGRFMTYGITLGQYTANDFSFEGDSLFAAEPVRAPGQQPIMTNGADNSGQPFINENDYLLYGSGQSDQIYDDDGFEKIPPELLDPNYYGDMQQTAQNETVDTAKAPGNIFAAQQQEAVPENDEVFVKIDPARLLEKLRELKKGLEEKHTISFIGGGASDEMDKLRKSVKSVIDYLDGKEAKEIDNKTLKSKIGTMKETAAFYIGKKKENSVRYKGNSDWKPLTGMGKTRIKAAGQIEQLNYKDFVTEHSIIEKEQQILKQLSKKASAMDPKADISDLRLCLAETLASVYAKSVLLPHDKEPKYDAVIKDGDHSGKTVEKVLAEEIVRVKEHKDFRRLMRSISSPKDIVDLCDSVVDKDPTKASNSIAMEMKKVSEKASSREKANRSSVKRRLNLDVTGDGLINKEKMKK